MRVRRGLPSCCGPGEPSRHTYVWLIPCHDLLSAGRKYLPAWVERVDSTGEFAAGVRSGTVVGKYLFCVSSYLPRNDRTAGTGLAAGVRLAVDPSPPYRNLRARQQVGHGVRGRRSACEAGAPHFPNTAMRPQGIQPWFPGS